MAELMSRWKPFGGRTDPAITLSFELIYLFQYRNVRHDHMVCGGRRRY
jgi:hypothetical protein